MASPPEDVPFDAPLHVGPRFQPDRSGVDGLNASVDLGIPGGVGIGVDGAVEAGEQLGRDFCPRLSVGISTESRLLVVAYTEREGRIRIIHAQVAAANTTTPTGPAPTSCCSMRTLRKHFPTQPRSTGLSACCSKSLRSSTRRNVRHNLALHPTPPRRSRSASRRG